MEEEDYIELGRRLGHRFEARELLLEALTHRSFANEKQQLAPRDNERLEFLGDAVLSLVTSQLLWERFPKASEGELTRRRADLVCEASLAAVAKEIGLNTYLRLGKGEKKSGGEHKPRLLASALEACFGALWLDGGATAAFASGLALFASRFEEERPGARDFKSRLQERLQGLRLAAPRYELLRVEGPDHERSFWVNVRVDGKVVGSGSGRSKLEAEQAAAQEGFALLLASPERFSASEAKAMKQESEGAADADEPPPNAEAQNEPTPLPSEGQSAKIEEGFEG